MKYFGGWIFTLFFAVDLCECLPLPYPHDSDRTAGKNYPPEVKKALGNANALYVAKKVKPALDALQKVITTCPQVRDSAACVLISAEGSVPALYAVEAMCSTEEDGVERRIVEAMTTHCRFVPHSLSWCLRPLNCIRKYPMFYWVMACFVV